MSDMVKAAFIIGASIILSQGFYEVTPTQASSVVVKYNKITGESELCFAGTGKTACKPHKLEQH